MGRKHCGKRRNCLLRAVSPFPIVFSEGLFPRGVKRCHCVGMGQERTLFSAANDICHAIRPLLKLLLLKEQFPDNQQVLLLPQCFFFYMFSCIKPLYSCFISTVYKDSYEAICYTFVSGVRELMPLLLKHDLQRLAKRQKQTEHWFRCIIQDCWLIFWGHNADAAQNVNIFVCTDCSATLSICVKSWAFSFLNYTKLLFRQIWHINFLQGGSCQSIHLSVCSFFSPSTHFRKHSGK